MSSFGDAIASRRFPLNEPKRRIVRRWSNESAKSKQTRAFASARAHTQSHTRSHALDNENDTCAEFLLFPFFFSSFPFLFVEFNFDRPNRHWKRLEVHSKVIKSLQRSFLFSNAFIAFCGHYFCVHTKTAWKWNKAKRNHNSVIASLVVPLPSEVATRSRSTFDDDVCGMHTNSLNKFGALERSQRSFDPSTEYAKCDFARRVQNKRSQVLLSLIQIVIISVPRSFRALILLALFLMFGTTHAHNKQMW